MLTEVDQLDKPLKTWQLENKDSKLVETIMKIYSMECFIVYRLNQTSFNRDESMILYYGPYAAALSHIIGTSMYEASN